MTHLFQKNTGFLFWYFLHIKTFNSTTKGKPCFLKQKEPTKKKIATGCGFFGLFFGGAWRHHIAATAGFPRLSATWNHPGIFRRQGIRRPGDQTGRVWFLPPAICPGSNLPTRKKIHGIWSFVQFVMFENLCWVGKNDQNHDTIPRTRDKFKNNCEAPKCHLPLWRKPLT